MTAAVVPAPTTDPAGRDPATIASPATYARNAPVWIYRAGSWRPGLVLDSSARAALVKYRHTEGPATSVDTAFAQDLAVREEDDPVDRAIDPTGRG
jgi:hypothetical protein